MGASHFHPLQKAVYPWEGPSGAQLSPDPQALLPIPPPPTIHSQLLCSLRPVASGSAGPSLGRSFQKHLSAPILPPASRWLCPHWPSPRHSRVPGTRATTGTSTGSKSHNPGCRSQPSVVGTLPVTAAMGMRVGAEGRAPQGLWVPPAS